MADPRYFDILNDPELTPERQAAVRGVEVSYSPWQVAKDNFDNALLRSMTAGLSFLDIGASDRASGSKELTIDELQGLGLEADRPMTALEAVIANTIKFKGELNNRKNELIQEGTGDVALPLAGGFAGSLIDLPIYAAAESAILGIGALNATRSAGVAFSQLGRTTSRIAAGTSSALRTPMGQVLGRGAGVNAMAAAAIENPIQSYIADEVGYDFTDKDASDNIMYSALFGGLFEGIGQAFKAKSRARRDAVENLEAYTNGKNPSDGVKYTYDNERFGDAPKLEFQEGTKFSTDGRVYAAHLAPDRNFNQTTQRSFETSLGEGVTASTNRDFAIREATSFIDNEKGQILELDLNEVNLLPIDQVLPPEVKTSLVEKLREVDEGLANRVEKADGSARDIIESLEETASKSKNENVGKAVAKAIQESGFDGYRFEHLDSTGARRGGEADFGIHVFDPEKFTLRGVDDQNFRDLSQTNTAQYKDQKLADLEYYLDAKSDLFYDEAVYKELSDTEVKFAEDINPDRDLPSLDDLKELESLEDNNIAKSVESAKSEVNRISPELAREVLKASEFCNRI